MSHQSDIDVMLEVKAGQTDQLGVLFERYKNPLFSYFYRLTTDSAASEDLVQNVFMRILKYKHSFTGHGKFTTWMYHIAHNTSIDHFNKNARYQPTDFKTMNLIGDQSVDADVEQKEHLVLLEQALNLLDESDKQVLIMAKYQGLKYKEIGEILECTENNVKIRVFRALNALRDKFKLLERVNHEK